MGKNNAGKSNVFRLVTLAANWPTSTPSAGIKSIPLREGAWHMGWGNEPFFVSLAVEFSESEMFKLDTSVVDEKNGRFVHRIRCDPGRGQNGERVAKISLVNDKGSLIEDSNPYAAVVQVVKNHIIYLTTQRHIRTENASSGTLGPIGAYDGSQIKQWLNEVLVPRTQDARQVRDKFLSDVRSIDSFQNVTFQVAVEANAEIVVSVSEGDNGYPTPLEDCGAGLQMVAIVLAAEHMLPGSVVLVDDIENNLHPSAQEQFCKILAQRTTNSNGQVIFTTHSPAMLDHVPDDTIFEVERLNGISTIRPVHGETRPLLDVLRSLGYRPGLLRMADAVVFVEGVSDEAALRAWWQELFNEPPEPAVVFLQLGGSNMRHLTERTVRGLGRQVLVLLDSDKSRDSEEISPQAALLTNRLKSVAHVHVLQRRAIESYFSGRAVSEVLQLDHEPTIEEYNRLSDVAAGYRKAVHAGAIAAAMRLDELAPEIVGFLHRVRAASVVVTVPSGLESVEDGLLPTQISTRHIQ